MIELQYDRLRFSFRDLHPDAKCEISFQRTLRVPDNDETWPLPPGLGRFPIVHFDDFAAALPPKWKEHGGVAFPMYQFASRRGLRTPGERAIRSSLNTNSAIRQRKAGARNEMRRRFSVAPGLGANHFPSRRLCHSTICYSPYASSADKF
jgi:hypothetical protein